MSDGEHITFMTAIVELAEKAGFATRLSDHARSRWLCSRIWQIVANRPGLVLHGRSKPTGMPSTIRSFADRTSRQRAAARSLSMTAVKSW